MSSRNPDKKNGFILYDDFEEQFKLLPSEDVKKLMLAVFHYHKTEEMLELSLAPMLVFNGIKKTIDRNKEKYLSQCVRNKENIEKRWSRHKENNTTEYDRIRRDTKHTDKDKDKDKDIIHKKKNKEKKENAELINKIFCKWNEISKLKKHLPKKRTLSEHLKKKISARIKEFPEWKDWRRMFKAIMDSEVLGVEKTTWFNLDFVVRSSESFENVCNGWMEWKAEKKIKPDKGPVRNGDWDNVEENVKKSKIQNIIIT